MDEEDLAEVRAAQVIQTNDAFDVLGGTQADMDKKRGPVAGPSEAKFLDMIEPGKGKIGEQLLRKMGWREGQGVGPRVSLKARKRMARDIGIRLEDDPDDDMTSEASKHTYAPLDRPLVVYPAKENSAGLGYNSGATLSQALRQDNGSFTRADKGKGKATATEGGVQMPVGGAFGISALEDADEDDSSIYDSAPRPSTGYVELDDDRPTAFRSAPSSRFASVKQTSWSGAAVSQIGCCFFLR